MSPVVLDNEKTKNAEIKPLHLIVSCYVNTCYCRVFDPNESNNYKSQEGEDLYDEAITPASNG